MKKTKKSFSKKFKRNLASVCAFMGATSALTASASCLNFERGNDAGMQTGMQKIVGILLDICFYAGIALAIYGVYEIIMSFMQQQPEAKTKGIFMTMAGIVMMSLGTIVNAFVTK